MTHPLANNPTETFIQHYAKHRNVRQAGLAVGLTHTEAVRLLNRKDVAGRIREIWGEAVEAVVSCRSGETVSADALVEYCRSHLAGYKLPKSIRFVEALPRNAAGKILKRELRAG